MGWLCREVGVRNRHYITVGKGVPPLHVRIHRLEGLIAMLYPL